MSANKQPCPTVTALVYMSTGGVGEEGRPLKSSGTAERECVCVFHSTEQHVVAEDIYCSVNERNL